MELDRGQRRGPRAARRARGDRRRSWPRRRRARSCYGDVRRPARRRRATSPTLARDRADRRSPPRRAPTSACSTPRTGATRRRWTRAAVLGLDPAPLAETRCRRRRGRRRARAVARAASCYVGRSGARRCGCGRARRARRRCAGSCTCRCAAASAPWASATLGGVSSGAPFDAAEATSCSGWPGRRRSRWPRRRALRAARLALAGQRGGAGLACARGSRWSGSTTSSCSPTRRWRRSPGGWRCRSRRRSGRAARTCATAAVDADAYFAQWEAILADAEEPTMDELEVADPALVLERYTAPVDDAAGARIGRLVVLRDITREREAERLKSDLMATVSHELRTPLASVLGYAELLRTRELRAGDARGDPRDRPPEAKRLSALIDDFLDLQAIEQDRLALAREPFSVDELLAEQVRTFAGQSARARRSSVRVARRGARRRRPRAGRAGRREPALERDQVLARRRRRCASRSRARGVGAASRCADPGSASRRRSSRTCSRSSSACERGGRARGRHRPRFGSVARDRRRARRADGLRERRGPGLAVLVHAAAPNSHEPVPNCVPKGAHVFAPSDARP